jgi:parallel beta-helix repeat protein
MRPSQWGILAYDVAGATIAGNDIRDISTYWALVMFDSNDVTISGNDFYNNAYGLTFNNSSSVEVHQNDIVGQWFWYTKPTVRCRPFTIKPPG